MVLISQQYLKMVLLTSLEDEFKSSSHKDSHNDVSDSQNPQQTTEIIDKSIFNNYTLTFTDNLVDNIYLKY